MVTKADLSNIGDTEFHDFKNSVQVPTEKIDDNYDIVKSKINNITQFIIDNSPELTGDNIFDGDVTVTGILYADEWAPVSPGVDMVVKPGVGGKLYRDSVTADNEIRTKSETEADVQAIADAAAASETAAGISEINAAASEAAAAISESNAGISETNAGISETNAGNSETAAAASEAAAAISEGNALTYSNNAAISAGNAVVSESNANASAAKAEDWAEELEDVQVEVGQYSALHHAAKASASASAASTSEGNAAISESNASTSEGNASTSEGNALTYSNNANNSAIAAAASAATAASYAAKVASLILLNNSTAASVQDEVGDIFFRVPTELNGFNLTGVAASVGTAGTTGTLDIQVHNITQAADMLTTKLTIDSGEKDSSTAATPAVIDTLNDDVAAGDQIRIDIDAIHTTPSQGLVVELQFEAP